MVGCELQSVEDDRCKPNVVVNTEDGHCALEKQCQMDFGILTCAGLRAAD